ncbi:MAG: twin-arginine translocase TatA/TatE family subunit [Candidatus Hydrogenedentota bacterium]
MGNIRFDEVLLIIVIVILLFGAKRIPDLMRQIGRSITEFKKGLKEDKNQTEKEDNKKM